MPVTAPTFAGFAPEAAEMFRWKDIVFGRPLSDDEILSADLPDRLADGYATATPIFPFLASLD